MKRALILAVLFPSVAWGQTSTAQFVPPNGLPLDTPLGAARNADGTGGVTFATMLAGISSAVTPAQMQTALADYLTISSAASTYATLSSVNSAVQTETNRAESAEQANAGAIVSLQSSALSKDDAALTYLPITGGNTSGPLNGVMTFQSLVGSSASGASTVLTTDGSGAVNGTNCLQVPSVGITEAVINVLGISSNGTDAVMQVYPGIALFTAANGVPAIQGTSATYYPTFGTPGTWSVAAAVDAATKCVVITTKGSGSGTWKWRASVHYETLAG